MKEFRSRHSILSFQGLVFMALLAAIGLVWLNGSNERKNSPPALKGEPAGAGRNRAFSQIPPENQSVPPTAATPGSAQTNAVVAIEKEFRHLYDSSTNGVLISKADSVHELGKDLWLQDIEGRERFIAQEVIGAKFSPDGNKIVYSTHSREVFIETLQGERLAQFPRAFDPSWRADSAAVSFFVVPSLDYPDVQHPVTHELNPRKSDSIESASEDPDPLEDLFPSTTPPQPQNQNKAYETK